MVTIDAPVYHVDRMIRMAGDKPSDATLEEIVRRIVAAINPDQIILFGSRARGDARPDSDYDFLVIKETAERTLKLEQAAYQAMLGANTGPVDILVETPERVDRLKSAIGTVFPDALLEGRVVYARFTTRGDSENAV